MARALDVNENSAEDDDKEAARSSERESGGKTRGKPTGKALQVNENSEEKVDQAPVKGSGAGGIGTAVSKR
jgi:hypothetical protein